MQRISQDMHETTNTRIIGDKWQIARVKLMDESTLDSVGGSTSRGEPSLFV